MDPVISQIRDELSQNIVDEDSKAGFQRFFKEEVQYYGVKTGVVVKIAKKFWKEVKCREKNEIFQICEQLYQSGYCEEAFIVSSWMADYSDRFEIDDIHIFERWINNYITNWATCDGFCNHAIGDYIVKFPSSIPDILAWTRSPNRWMRRASAVSFIIPAKRGMFLEEVFTIADSLLTDADDMVQKGYGWLLKEASRVHQGEVFSYVIEHKRNMPRTALRYAIELMPTDLRSAAMMKDW